MIRGSLLTGFFLEDGIRETDPYRVLTPEAVSAFADDARTRWAALETMRHPSEAETEAEFIYPLLTSLGWLHLPQQTPGHGRRDIADALLFLTEDLKARARREAASADRFRLGVTVVENEARDTLLDRASGKAEAPSTQILRYLGRAEAQSGGKVKWGLLTNGRFWRLYWADAPNRVEGFIELDLPALLGDPSPPVPDQAPADHWLRVFLLLFGRDALVADGTTSRIFLDDAIAEGRRYEQRITAGLSQAVFDNAFPGLVAAIAREAGATDPPTLAAARDAALRLLFRLLFLLYAEDRDLLPVRDDG